MCLRVIRVDEGSVSKGFTVQEAVQLLRSSLPAQQVAALRTISAILVQARPAGVGGPDAVLTVPVPASGALSLSPSSWPTCNPEGHI